MSTMISVTSPVLLPDTEAFDLAPASEGAGGAARGWRIFRSIPRGPAPESGFPVIYMLDANAGFASFHQAMARAAGRPSATGVSEAVIVGIGYPEGEDIRTRRAFDFTVGPSRDAAAEPPRPERASLHGGRDAFLRFIETTLKPAIAARVPVDPARQTLFGHSLAGWFTLDVMTRDPGAFAAYVAVSPSIWWDEARLNEGLAGLEDLAGLEYLAGLESPPPRLALMVGEWEEALAPWQADRPEAAEMAARRAQRAMVARARAFAAQVAATLGPAAQVRFDRMAGEDHASILPAAMTRALRFALEEGHGRAALP
ncbi:alpha/beta hydrolase [Ancylobacter amanitiformis]|uniref:Alpha/beta superfamily hydrolase n=1 Tax=Ancylobacter amanitiformis TaxID=217069 RepID=A0ABU0LRY0_9HYPH|nr:alpha/beta hydrolase-fold protein [Ancylobacter amanitiformis]MDQ0511459.1 putative alpha/beta superfamily hydrolase [Ancylobacter amanitiformis]